MIITLYMQMAIAGMVVLFTILLGFLVYKNDKHSVTNQIFGFLSLITVCWLVSISLSTISTLSQYYLITSRLSVYFAVPQSFAFFLLASTLPSVKLQMKRKYFYPLLCISIGVMVLALTPLVFSSADLTGEKPKLVIGMGMPLFVAFVSFCSVGAIVTLIRRLRKAKTTERRQFQLMLAGIFIMLSLIISTIMVPVIFLQQNGFLSLAPVYVLFFLTTTAVAILKYHLFNIRVLATEMAVTALVLVLLFEGFVSGSSFHIIWKTLVATLVGLLGITVVHSVTREIKQREEVTHLANSLEKANLRLQELDQQKTEFLSIASHQLRTPLSILKGYIELIKDGAYGKPSHKLVAILDDMDESNERLVKLVDEFLDISRIEQGRTKFSFAPHNPAEVIESIIKEIEDRAKDKKLTLSWGKMDIGVVTMDEEKIRHVIFNFVDNAIKYSEHGAVHIILEKDKDGMVVRVQDEGLGFNKTDEVNFYQKFYRGENVKNINVNGTGLGLYVCRKFIEAHRGYVWAKSEGLGKGSEFGFWIPLK